MEVCAPKYYEDFACLAGECPHTCCACWEVPIDEETARLYETLPGELGERLRAAMCVDEEGARCFQLKDGFCPFLDGDRLCELYRTLGETAMGAICRSHPRFSNEFGPVREVGLCASCPEAARLVLESEPEFSAGEDGEPGGEGPELLSPLRAARGTAIKLLARREFPLGERLQALLLFANEVQVLVDEGAAEELPRLCAIYREEFPLLSGGLPEWRGAMEDCLEQLLGLDILQEEWRQLLLAGKAALAKEKTVSLPKEPGERAGVYFLYRHWLRGVWDGDVLSWAEFTVLGVAVCALLAPLHGEGFPGVFRLFCLELEHSAGNLAAMQDGFCERLGLAELLAVAGLGETAGAE